MIFVNQLRKLFAASLAAAVMFAFGYHELHYLFTQHQPTEHCDNHLHGAEESHCDFCKIDLLVVAEGGIAPSNKFVVHFPPTYSSGLQTNHVSLKKFTSYLRGPPLQYKLL